eukprot:75909_1
MAQITHMNADLNDESISTDLDDDDSTNLDDDVLNETDKNEIDENKIADKPITVDTDNTDNAGQIDVDNYQPKSKPNAKPNFGYKPDPNILNKLNKDAQIAMQNKIQSHLINNPQFWIRICILIVVILLTLLSLSYAFGAVSSTELKVITQCSGYDLQTIWNHNFQQGNQGGGDDKCWRPTTIRVDFNEVFYSNSYQYQTNNSATAVFQCIIFSLFVCVCLGILIYGGHTLIMDVKAVSQQNLYTKSVKFHCFMKNLNVASVNAIGKIIDIHMNNQNENINRINIFFKRWKDKYDEYFGTDTNGYISRIIAAEILEIIIQTGALSLYNGFNIFDPNNVYLAYQSEFIILFVSILSFNCFCVGILWILYVFKHDKCNGFLFSVCLFCMDQFFDFIYAIYPFIVIFGDQNYKAPDDKSMQIWIAFGLLNNNLLIYSAFPMLLLCTKCSLTTRTAIKEMRNKSYDVWLLITKVMNAPNDKDIDYITNTLGYKITIPKSDDKNDNDKTNVISDEIYDSKGNLQLNVSSAKSGQTQMHATTKCRITITSIGLLFIMYSVIILSFVINHLYKSQNYCNNVNNASINHLELYMFYDGCEYKVYPFTFSSDQANNCQCRIFFKDLTHLKSDTTINSNIIVNQYSIVDEVLKKWTMLERFSFFSSNIPGKSNHDVSTNSQEFNFLPSHFGATEMKIFHLSNVDVAIIDAAISNWKQLEYFEINQAANLKVLPQSFSQLSQLKVIIFRQSTNLGDYLNILCNLKKLIVIKVTSGKETYLPHCITNLDNLQQLTVQSNNLIAFSLGILNMTHLKELNLWNNQIAHDNILNYNNININNDILGYYVNSMPNMTIFLNGNVLCTNWLDNVLPSGSQLWVNTRGVCQDLDCSNPSTSATNLDAYGCDPSFLADGFCDLKCNNTNCFMDKGDCFQFCFVQTDCSYQLFLNDVCDQKCNNEYCYWDNYKCQNGSTDIESGNMLPPGTKPTSDGKAPPP